MSIRNISFLLLILGFTVAPELHAQGRNFYGFKNIAHGHARIGMSKQIDYPPDDYYADIHGGYLEIFLAKGSCSDKYRFSWKFLDDMSKIEPGQVYKAELKAERIEGDCNQNEAWGQLYGSNERCRFCTDHDLGGPNNTVAVKGLNDVERTFAVPEDYPKTADYEVTVSRVSDEMVYVFLSFSCKSNPSPSENFDYQIVYVYQKNYQPQTGSVGFDCQMLYGLGTHMAFLEKAAESDADMEVIEKHLDGAIDHVRASNCLDADYLLDLKARLKEAGSAKSFYEEIRDYREALPALINGECLE